MASKAKRGPYQQFDVPVVRRPSSYWDSSPISSTFVELLGFKSHYFDICNTELSNTETRPFGMFESKGDQKNDFLKELRMFVGTSIFYYDNIEKQVTLINLIKTT